MKEALEIIFVHYLKGTYQNIKPYSSSLVQNLNLMFSFEAQQYLGNEPQSMSRRQCTLYTYIIPGIDQFWLSPMPIYANPNPYYNHYLQMDFIAMKCNLGIAIKQALQQIVFDEDGRKKAESLYKQIFLSHYNKFRDDLPEVNLTGKVFTWKQYPDEKSRQYFEALIYEPKMNPSKERADVPKPGKFNFARIEAMQPEGQNQKKESKVRRSNKSKVSKRKHTSSSPTLPVSKKRKLNP